MYAIKATAPLSNDIFAVVYMPWPWPPKTRCPMGWTPYYWDATKFDTHAEATSFVGEADLAPGTIISVVGL